VTSWENVSAANILDVAQPIVDQSEPVVAQSGQDTATAVVTADNDMLDPQYLDRVLEDRQAVQVGVNDQVRHVPMNEQLPWKAADDLVGRHSAVGAADPQVFRGLLLGEA
jgi:hypothetical protein